MIELLKNTVKQAGNILLEGFYSPKNVKYKGFGDIVTETDVRIENFLWEALSKKLPDYDFIAEENHKSSNFSGKCIIVDPIDGTTNFVHKLPFVAISIGVYEYGKSQLGIVFNPILNEMYNAQRGCGAFLNNIKLSVSETDKIEDSLIATGFPYDFTFNNKQSVLWRLDRIISQTRGVRRFGAASIDLCFVAKGIFEGYYEGGLKPWDVAAGALIVEEAGGVISDISGGSYCFDKDFIVASNKGIFKKFIEVLNG